MRNNFLGQIVWAFPGCQVVPCPPINMDSDQHRSRWPKLTEADLRQEKLTLYDHNWSNLVKCNRHQHFPRLGTDKLVKFNKQWIKGSYVHQMSNTVQPIESRQRYLEVFLLKRKLINVTKSSMLTTRTCEVLGALWQVALSCVELLSVGVILLRFYCWGPVVALGNVKSSC